MFIDLYTRIKKKKQTFTSLFPIFSFCSLIWELGYQLQQHVLFCQSKLLVVISLVKNKDVALSVTLIKCNTDVSHCYRFKGKKNCYWIWLTIWTIDLRLSILIQNCPFKKKKLFNQPLIKEGSLIDLTHLY